MLKSVLKWSGVMCAIAAWFLLRLPMFNVSLESAEVSDFVVYGQELFGSSAWGALLPMLAPVLLALVASRVSSGTKTVGVLGMFLLNGAAFGGAAIATYWQLSEMAATTMQPRVSMVLYLLLWLVATICLWLAENIPFSFGGEEEDDEETAAKEAAVGIEIRA